MYDSVEDPYCYPGTTVLKNRRNLRTQKALNRFETAITAQRFNEPMPVGKLTEQHYRRVHRHIFGDVYVWAGEYREKVRIGKSDSTFCYLEYIAREMKKLFDRLRHDKNLGGLSKSEFARGAAVFLATLNAIHPFRDGNGRSQLAFMGLLAKSAGYELRFSEIVPEDFLLAMIESLRNGDGLLVAQFAKLL